MRVVFTCRNCAVVYAADPPPAKAVADCPLCGTANPVVTDSDDRGRDRRCDHARAAAEPTDDVLRN
ncbi:MAG TPA: hypothetical protein VGF55_06455 [Gemmataceae bacterium]|jgi:hypothetical protein